MARTDGCLEVGNIPTTTDADDRAREPRHSVHFYMKRRGVSNTDDAPLLESLHGREVMDL
jgi:hypothetical protein